jgi:pyruvate formate lyase activating enzyme
VFTGSEPTAQPALTDAMVQARELDYLAGVRTKGSRPHRLAEVLSVADWVSLEVGGTDFVAALTSLELVMRSGVEYEVTLTVDPALHSREDILATARAVIRRGAHAPVLQGRRIYQVIRLDDLPDLERR